MNRGKAKRQRKLQARQERLGDERGAREVMAWVRNIGVPPRESRRHMSAAAKLQLELEEAKAAEYGQGARDPRAMLAEEQPAQLRVLE